MNRSLTACFFASALLALAAWHSPALAQDDVLAVIVGEGFYNADMQKIADVVETEALAAGGSVTSFVLSPTAVLPDTAPYEQIWVLDLSHVTDKSPTQLDAYQAIADWWHDRGEPDVIFDGRIISSVWTVTNIVSFGYPDDFGRPETALLGNYYRNLVAAGGGLVLGTDHDVFHSGINEINTACGFNPFYGFWYASPFLVELDVESSLASWPSFAGHHEHQGSSYVWADSSIGFTPLDAQPNGKTVYGVAYTPDSARAPAISTTLPFDACLGVECTSPDACHDAFCDPLSGECVSATITCTAPDECSTAACDPSLGCFATPIDTDADGVPDCDDGCPADSLKTDAGLCGCGFADFDNDHDGVAESCASDADNDGVPDATDACASTAPDAPVDATGCSVDDRCPCLMPWRNHGAYVTCVNTAVRQLVVARVVSSAEGGAMISTRARSSCGK
jgi:hypothetical protein